MNTKNFPDNLKRKRNEANTRQEEYDKLTVEQKLERLPRDGSKKQRARLLALLGQKHNG